MYGKANEMFQVIVENPNLTEREIAERVGLKKTPYTRNILLALIAEGSIARAQDPTRERFTYVYFVQQTEPLPGMEL
jgi:predicted transcriptional regulator